jgi:hypothetical protein
MVQLRPDSSPPGSAIRCSTAAAAVPAGGAANVDGIAPDRTAPIGAVPDAPPLTNDNASAVTNGAVDLSESKESMKKTSFARETFV